MARATAGQAKRSWTRRQAAVAEPLALARRVMQAAQRGGQFLGSPGVTSTAASPVTSGSAPVRLATSGVPEAMCSTAGSENPSYSEGTTAISALAARLGELVVADAGDEAHPVAERELGDEPLGRAAGGRLADDDQVHIPLGGQLRRPRAARWRCP